MSDVPQTLSLIILGQLLRGPMVSQISRRSATLRLFPFKEAAGQNIAWSVSGTGALVENFAEGATASNFGSDEQRQALLAFGRVRSNFHITGTAQRAAKTHQAGPQGLQSLIGQNMQDAAAAVASEVNVETFSGTGASNQMTGLDEAIGKDDNTYANIDRASVTYWRPYVVDPGVLTLPTFALIRKDLGQIYDNSGEQPDIALCSTAVFNTVRALFDSNVTYVNELTTPRGVVKLGDGFQGVNIDGCTFIKDKDATANRIYYLNSNYVHYEYAALDPDLLDAIQRLAIKMPADDGFGMTPLGIRCEKIAKLGDADRFQALTELNLVVRKPRACGVRKNVQVSA